ncbi:MAG: diguanylate cyclase (GGDEF)-like protein [Candidatus Azotimanducaceae bacterium]|jgi:diguanylate cyclase
MHFDDNAKLMTRTTEEIIVLSVSAICVIGLAPFVLIRLLSGDILIAIVDGIGFTFTIGIFVYVYRTHKLGYSGLFLTLLANGGMVVITLKHGPDNIYFFYPTLVAAFYLVEPRKALLICAVSISAISPVLFENRELVQLLQFLFSMLGCVLFAFVFSSQSKKQRDQLVQLSTIDALTGAGNRRALDDKLQSEIEIYKRTGNPMSVILLDFDNFKEVNDNRGHAAGDDLLIRISSVIKERIRTTDSLFRYGGDEFVVLAANADLETSSQLAEDLRALVDADESVSGYRVSISLGVAEYQRDESMPGWLGRADAALFESKRSGRNRVMSSHKSSFSDQALVSNQHSS